VISTRIFSLKCRRITNYAWTRAYYTVFASSDERILYSQCKQQSQIIVHTELQTSGTFVSRG